MSIVYDAGLPADRPQMHVLAIGIDDYRHLPNGSAYGTAPALETFGLEALRSPCVSASAFASWFGDRNPDNPRVPLGTVDVMLTTGAFEDASGRTFEVGVPTMAAIKETAAAWKERCNRHEGNIAVFYYCGHGWDGAYTMLLPADFGDPDPNVTTLWDNVIDFTTSYNAMLAECKAATQLYLIDACRSQAVQLQTDQGRARPIWTTRRVAYPRRDAPILRSTTRGAQAHAQPGAVSYFTKALLDCLDLFGAKHQNAARWEVTTASLTQAMKVYMSRTHVPGVPPQSCDAGGGTSTFDTVLHRLGGTPRVMATIECLPSDALARARLSVANEPNKHTRPPRAEPWEIDLDVGDYDVRADFPQGTSYASMQVRQRMFPPDTPCTLEVRP